MRGSKNDVASSTISLPTCQHKTLPGNTFCSAFSSTVLSRTNAEDSSSQPLAQEIPFSLRKSTQS